MKFLVFTTLYPNAETPAHGVFVENRLRAFLKRHDADVKVVAPVPWFPFSNAPIERYTRFARVPEKEIRHGIEILHPRYLIPPKTAMRVAPAALTRCLRKTAAALIADGWDFDLIDAHYLYPDGGAAVDVAREMGKPVVVTVRGTDVTLLPSFAGPRRKIIETVMRADAVITVADALKDELVRLGAPAQKITTLRNGVDLETFKPGDRARIRHEMALDGPVLASVGHLIDRKGHDIVIEALRDIPDATLLVAGEGEKRKALEALAESCGVGDRVRFLGAVAHENLARIYNAADILVLASSREGWPNVLLEAMACGTPCLAANVGGAKEVIREPAAGAIVNDRTPEAFAVAAKALFAAPYNRGATRRYAEAHSWDKTADAMAAMFSSLIKKKDTPAVTTAPIRLNNASGPKLIVTVDTEERFDWEDFEETAHDCCPPEDVARFQEICAAAGARPLYFLTWPLLNNKPTVAFFRSLFQSGGADGGLHLHQWTTPPESDFSGEYFSFQKNLPRDLHRKKLKVLADAFEASLGLRARAHRAGRYGIAPENYELLAEAGVAFDFSPSAGFDFSGRGGPDFSGMANAPFVVSGEPWNIAVTPLCSADAIRRTPFFVSRKTGAPGFSPPAPRRAHLKPMRLSPEGATLGEMKSLTRRLIADDVPVLTFTLHSTSLTIGANAYGKDAKCVERILETSRAYFDWFRSIGGEFVSLADLATLYGLPGAAPRV